MALQSKICPHGLVSHPPDGFVGIEGSSNKDQSYPVRLLEGYNPTEEHLLSGVFVLTHPITSRISLPFGFFLGGRLLLSFSGY